MSNKTAAIFFFSGTGNSFYASKKISEALNNNNIPTKVYSIESVTATEANKIIKNNDIIIFGYPIYASYLPQPMIKFIEKLSTVKEKDCGIFCTQLIFSGDGAKIGDSFLKEKGFITKWAEHFNMPNNLNSGIFGFLPITNDRKKLDKSMRKTEKDCRNFASYITNNKIHLKGFGKFGYMLAKTQRPNDKPKGNMWAKSMEVDLKKCTSCGLCEKICPSSNFIKEEKGLKTVDKCSACMRCHNFCPVNAIIFQNKPNEKEHFRGIENKFNPIQLTNYKQ